MMNRSNITARAGLNEGLVRAPKWPAIFTHRRTRAAGEPRFDVFISFRSNDRRRQWFGQSIDVVAELKKTLERYRHPDTKRRLRVCTFEEDLELSGEVREAILEAIGNSRAVLFLSTRTAAESSYVQFELECASKTNGRLLPVLVDLQPSEAFPALFTDGAHAADLSTEGCTNLKAWRLRVELEAAKIAAKVWDVPLRRVRDRFVMDRRRRRLWNLGAVLALIIASIVALQMGLKRGERNDLFKQLRTYPPALASDALYRLLEIHREDPADLRHVLKERGQAEILEILEAGPGRFDENRRLEAMLAVLEVARPLFAEKDLASLGYMVWTLDYYSHHDPSRAESLQGLRDEWLAPLRKDRVPDTSIYEWVDIPAGELSMRPKGGWRPGRHRVEIPKFRMMAHEVTLGQFRLLVPGHRQGEFKDDRLPACRLNWYEAYAYAAWLGGRLPTGAEWEYAARAGSKSAYWSGNEVADLERVDWFKNNSEERPHRVKEKEANPWGLYDVHGNVWEWVANWSTEDPKAPWIDSWGPPSGLQRGTRGTSFRAGQSRARAASRGSDTPGATNLSAGFRVILP